MPSDFLKKKVKEEKEKGTASISRTLDVLRNDSSNLNSDALRARADDANARYREKAENDRLASERISRLTNNLPDINTGKTTDIVTPIKESKYMPDVFKPKVNEDIISTLKGGKNALSANVSSSFPKIKATDGNEENTSTINILKNNSLPKAEKSNLEKGASNIAGYTTLKFGAGLMNGMDLTSGFETGIKNLKTSRLEENVDGTRRIVAGYSEATKKLSEYLNRQPVLYKSLMESSGGFDTDGDAARIAKLADVPVDVVKDYKKKNQANYYSNTADENYETNTITKLLGDSAYQIGNMLPTWVTGAALSASSALTAVGKPSGIVGYIEEAVKGAGGVKSGAKNVTKAILKGTGKAFLEAAKGEVPTYLMSFSSMSNKSFENELKYGGEKAGLQFIDNLWNGYTEAFTESLSGIADLGIVGDMQNRVSGSVIKSLISSAVVSMFGMGDEAFEETVNVPLQAIGDKLLLDHDKKWFGSGGVFDIGAMKEAGISGSLMGAVLGSVSSVSTALSLVGGTNQTALASVYDINAYAENNALNPRTIRASAEILNKTAESVGIKDRIANPKKATLEDIKTISANIIQHNIDTVNDFYKVASEKIVDTVLSADELKGTSVEELANYLKQNPDSVEPESVQALADALNDVSIERAGKVLNSAKSEKAKVDSSIASEQAQIDAVRAENPNATVVTDFGQKVLDAIPTAKASDVVRLVEDIRNVQRGVKKISDSSVALIRNKEVRDIIESETGISIEGKTNAELRKSIASIAERQKAIMETAQASEEAEAISEQFESEPQAAQEQTSETSAAESVPVQPSVTEQQNTVPYANAEENTANAEETITLPSGKKLTKEEFGKMYNITGEELDSAFDMMLTREIQRDTIESDTSGAVTEETEETEKKTVKGFTFADGFEKTVADAVPSATVAEVSRLESDIESVMRGEKGFADSTVKLLMNDTVRNAVEDATGIRFTGKKNRDIRNSLVSAIKSNANRTANTNVNVNTEVTENGRTEETERTEGRDQVLDRTGERSSDVNDAGRTEGVRTAEEIGGEAGNAAVSQRSKRRTLAETSGKRISERDFSTAPDASDVKSSYLLEEKDWDDDLRTLADRLEKETGRKVHFVTGGIATPTGRMSNGFITNGNVVIRCDSDVLTPEQIAYHEVYHAYERAIPDLTDDLIKKVRDHFTPEQISEMVDAYFDALPKKFYEDFEKAKTEELKKEAMHRVWSEIFADTQAGIDYTGKGINKKLEGFTKPYVEGRVDAMNKMKLETDASPPAIPAEIAETSTPESVVNENPMEAGETVYSYEQDERLFDESVETAKANGFYDKAIYDKASEDRRTVHDAMQDIYDEKKMPNDGKLLPREKKSALTKNGSYGFSAENSLVCVRSLAVDAFVKQAEIDFGRKLTMEEMLYAAQEIGILLGQGDTQQCAYCYVNADRMAYHIYMHNAFVEQAEIYKLYDSGVSKSEMLKIMEDRYNADGKKPSDTAKNRWKMWYESADRRSEGLTEADTAGMLASEKTEIAKFRSGLSTELKKKQFDVVQKYAQSASHAKQRVNYVAYNGGILEFTDAQIKKLNQEYGLRMYSYSDYSPAFVLENMQMITDAAARGLKVLAYTKELDFVRIFAPTGANIEISVYGEFVDGQWVEDDMQGANWAEAQKLREQYPNVGITFVATNDASKNQAKQLPWVDVVLPYHSVFAGGSRVAVIKGYTDYKAVQEDKKTKEHTSSDAKSIMPPVHNNDLMTYLDACEKNNLVPRFRNELVLYDEFRDGNVSKESFIEANKYYMKFVNETRQSANDSRPVVPVFNAEAAVSSIDKMRKQGGYNPPLLNDLELEQDAYSDIEQGILNGEAERRSAESVRQPVADENDDVIYHSYEISNDEEYKLKNGETVKAKEYFESLPESEFEHTYKSMSFWGYDKDGNAILRSPMAENVDGSMDAYYIIRKDGVPVWYKADEDTSGDIPKGMLVKLDDDSYVDAAENKDLIEDDWSNLYFKLKRKNVETGDQEDVIARYNPYEHSSNSMFNDQFKGAYKRPNLVTVEMKVPKSEIGAYRAKYSKDGTGWVDWKSGTVSTKISKQNPNYKRDLFLSRYATPVRIVGNDEVAREYKRYTDGTDVKIPSTVVSPGLLYELRKVGVPIEEDEKVSEYEAELEESRRKVSEKKKKAEEKGKQYKKGNSKFDPYEFVETYDENGNKVTLSAFFKSLKPNEDTIQRSFEQKKKQYDFGKPFEEQIEDLKSGVFPHNNVLVVGKTPDVFREIGLLPLPMTYTQKHVIENLANKDGSHLGEDIKKLPQAIENPVAIFDSVTMPGRLTAILKMPGGSPKTFIAIEVDGTAKLNNDAIASNAIVSAYEKEAAFKLLENAIDKEKNGNGGLYYINKNETDEISRASGVQFPGVDSISNGFIRSIHHPLSKVNSKYKNIFETPQFKKWFGKSVFTNDDGTPKVFYHQTTKDFTVFNTDNPSAGKYDSETPNGIFFKTNDHDIGLSDNDVRTKQMAVYLRAENVLKFANRKEANKWYCKNVPGYESVQNEMNSKIKPIDSKMDEIENDMFADGISDEEYDRLNDQWNSMLEEMHEIENDYRGRLRTMLTDYFVKNNSGYDAIELEFDGQRNVNGKTEKVHTVIVFSPNQVKSATDNIGTFNRENDDISHSYEPKNTLSGSQGWKDFIAAFDAEYGKGEAEKTLRSLPQIRREMEREKNRQQTEKAVKQIDRTENAVEAIASANKSLDKLTEQRANMKTQKGRDNNLLKARSALISTASDYLEANAKQDLKTAVADEREKAKKRLALEKRKSAIDKALSLRDQRTADAIEETKAVRKEREKAKEKEREINITNDKTVSEAESARREMFDQTPKENAEERAKRERDEAALDAFTGNARTRQERAEARTGVSADSEMRAVPIAKRDVSNEDTPVNLEKQVPIGAKKKTSASERVKNDSRRAYELFRNDIIGIDTIGNRQRKKGYAVTASDLAYSARHSAGTTGMILTDALRSRDGSKILDNSFNQTFLCYDENGKFSEDMQRVLQKYMTAMLAVDSMSLEDRAWKKVDDYIEEHPWIREYTDSAFRDAVFDDKDRRKEAKEFSRLYERAAKTKNKDVFANSLGYSVGAEQAQKIADEIAKEQPWVVEKANGIYEWWDTFMREWAVGDGKRLSEEAYERMREETPHYMPAYREGFERLGKIFEKREGSVREIKWLQDSFAHNISQIVREQKMNELLLNLVDTAMLDTEGTFGDYLNVTAEDLEAEGIVRTDGMVYPKGSEDGKIRAWDNGKQVVASIQNPELQRSLKNIHGNSIGDAKWFVKAGRKFTSPMKRLITGTNPAFGLRNIPRDIGTAIMNTEGKPSDYLKYWIPAFNAVFSENGKYRDIYLQWRAIGGGDASYYSEEGGFARNIKKLQKSSPKSGWKAALDWMEGTEQTSRFAEYLRYIQEHGNTYENRLKALKLSAEVTTDFSRNGTLGRVINAWVPYWNPGKQGTDKFLRNIFEGTEGVTKGETVKNVLKNAAKTMGRAAVVAAAPEILCYIIAKALGREDEWMEITDYQKDNYFMIPNPADKNKWFRVPKTPIYGMLIGTPIRRTIEGLLEGRDNAFKDYDQQLLDAFSLPNGDSISDAVDSSVRDVVVFGQFLDLYLNEDFTGAKIVPNDLANLPKEYQYSKDTSAIAYAVGKAFNASPEQIDYLIYSYLGDFWSGINGMASLGLFTGESTAEEKMQSGIASATKPFVVDSRYSNRYPGEYYDMLDEIDKDIAKGEATGANIQPLKDAKSAINTIYGKEISAAYKRVRESTDNDEKDDLRRKIADLTLEAVEYGKEVMNGEHPNAKLEAEYRDYSPAVQSELIRLKDFNADYSFEPTTFTVQTKFKLSSSKTVELTDAQKDVYRTYFRNAYNQLAMETMNSAKYKKAKDSNKAEMLEDVYSEARDIAKKYMKEYIKK